MQQLLYSLKIDRSEVRGVGSARRKGGEEGRETKIFCGYCCFYFFVRFIVNFPITRVSETQQRLEDEFLRARLFSSLGLLIDFPRKNSRFFLYAIRRDFADQSLYL